MMARRVVKKNSNERTDFTIVDFDGGDTVSLISSSWMCGKTKCYWPPTDHKKLAVAHAAVQNDWKLYNCRVIGNAATYEKAVMKEKMASINLNSNVDTEAEEITTAGRKKRHAQRPKRLQSDSDDTDEGETNVAVKKVKNGSCPVEVPVVPKLYLDTEKDPLGADLLNSFDDQSVHTSSDLMDEHIDLSIPFAADSVEHFNDQQPVLSIGDPVNVFVDQPSQCPVMDAADDQPVQNLADIRAGSNDQSNLVHPYDQSFTGQPLSYSGYLLDVFNNLPSCHAMDEHDGQLTSIDMYLHSDAQNIPIQKTLSEPSIVFGSLQPTPGSQQSMKKGSVSAVPCQTLSKPMLESRKSLSHGSVVAAQIHSVTPTFGSQQWSSKKSVSSALHNPSATPSVSPTSGSHESLSLSSICAAPCQKSVTPTSGSRQPSSESVVMAAPDRRSVTPISGSHKSLSWNSTGAVSSQKSVMPSSESRRSSNGLVGASLHHQSVMSFSGTQRSSCPGSFSAAQDHHSLTPTHGSRQSSTQSSVGALRQHSNSSVPSTNRTTSAAFSVKNESFQTSVLRMLVKVHGDVKDLSDRLDHVTTLVVALNGTNGLEDELMLPNNVQLPLESLENMEAMESAMLDKEFTRRLVSQLSIIGGKTLADVVGSQLKHMLSVSLQRQYSWCGMKGKRPFGTLHMAKALIKAVRKHRKFAEVTDREIRDACAAFFTNARDRRRSEMAQPFEDESSERLRFESTMSG